MSILRDLSVDASNDLVISGGDLVLNFDLDAIAQDCKAVLMLVLGEWYMDTTAGVDWYGKILVKNPNPNVIRAMLRASLLTVVGVKDVTSIAMDFTDRTRRKASVTFTVSTDLGEITSTVTGP